MDRKPLPAPFPEGTQVRYIGPDKIYEDAEGRLPLLAPGMVFTIEEAKPGRQGTLRQIPFEEGDDEFEPILDETRDGCSVYYRTRSNGHRGGRIIWPSDAHEWEIA
jgi:hypothetical protein